MSILTKDLSALKCNLPDGRPVVFAQTYTRPDSYEYGKPISSKTISCFPHCVEPVMMADVSNWKQQLKEVLDKNGNGLINSESGGIVVLGVDKDYVAHGVEMDETLRNDFKESCNCMLHHFDPPVAEDLFSVHFIPVTGSPSLTNNAVVAEILLKPPAVPSLFQSSKGMVYLKNVDKLEGPLRLSRVQEVLVERFRCMFFAELKRCDEQITVLREQVSHATTFVPKGEWKEPKLPTTNGSQRPFSDHAIEDEDDKEKAGCCGRRKQRKSPPSSVNKVIELKKPGDIISRPVESGGEDASSDETLQGTSIKTITP